jgi:hypothetical protein
LHENGGSGGITVQGSFEKRKEATMSEENPHLSKEKAKILSKSYLQDYQEAEKPSNQTLKPTHIMRKRRTHEQKEKQSQAKLPTHLLYPSSSSTNPTQLISKMP